MANLLSISATQTPKKVTFPKVKATDKDSSIVQKFCTYYANIRKSTETALEPTEVGSLAVDVFGQENVHMAYRTKDILNDIEGIGYDLAHVVNKIKPIYGSLKPKGDADDSSLFDDQILLALDGSRLPASIDASYHNRTLYLLVVDDAKVKVPYKTNLTFWRDRQTKTLTGMVSFSFLELMSIHSEGLYKICGHYSETRAIARAIKEQYEDALAVNLNARYTTQSTKTIAGVTSDKIYQDQELNESTAFLQLGFSKVEVDTERYQGVDFDKEKFKELENDWLALCNQLPHSKVLPELKFRKLGKHKASGLYVPILNILAVDVRDSTSFIHEYGHYLDYTYGESGVISSTSHSFKDIRSLYEKSLMKLIDGAYLKMKEVPKEDVLEYRRTEKMLAQAKEIEKKWEYYLTPTEVFARGFELWVFETYSKESELLADEETYYTHLEYAALRQCRHLLFAFFDTYFEHYRDMQPVFTIEDKQVQTIAACRKPSIDESTLGAEQLTLFDLW